LIAWARAMTTLFGKSAIAARSFPDKIIFPWAQNVFDLEWVPYRSWNSRTRHWISFYRYKNLRFFRKPPCSPWHVEMILFVFDDHKSKPCRMSQIIVEGGRVIYPVKCCSIFPVSLLSWFFGSKSSEGRVWTNLVCYETL
jgi:hypothetical protein